MRWRFACDAGRVLSRTWLLLLSFSVRAQDVRVVPAEVPAAGRHTAVVTVPRFGRYALAAMSREGVALTVVDRMAGPGERVGSPGEYDGRVDLFLDRGEVRVVTNGDAKTKGRAKLTALPFIEKNGAAPPQLMEQKPVATTLADLEQRSWWISLDARRHVAFEAAGRRLADLRLWREGSWLEPAEPESEVTTPAPGRPVRVMRLHADLAPGLYLLSAYGGQGEPWAEESDESPLHVRWGVPRLGVTGRARHVLGPSGIDRYLVGGAVTFVGIEVPEARPISVGAVPWDEASPFHEPESSASIDKRTNPPATWLNVAGPPDGLTLVTVRGDAGQPYVLTHLDSRDRYAVKGAGDYWVGTVPSSDLRDAVDETGLLVEADGRTPMETAAVETGPGHPWTGRGNLDGPLTLYVRVAAAGRYDVEATGADAKVQLAPALARRSDEIKPLTIRNKGTVDLDAGLWELTARPAKKGILTLALHAAGEKAAAPGAPRGGLLFPKVRLSPTTWYTLHVGKRPGVFTGLVLRELPLDLAEPLAVAARPGDAVTVPFTAKEEALLTAETEDGAALPISVDGAPAAPRPRVSPGPHTARVALAGDAPRVVSLAALPARLAPEAPLPPLPDGALAALPKLPELTEGAPRAFDVTQSEALSFHLNVPAPALYRIETTGLLAMGALLRTRTVTQFRNEGENGVGRNALVADYLREGDYQVTVQPRGPSEGHAGVTLTRTAVADGGAVTDGVPARVALEAGAAAAFTLDVKRAGTYRIRALGLKRKFAVRLEDRDGWPLVKPGLDGDLRRMLAKGTYRLVLLPLAVPARAVVTLDRLQAPLALRGHGPHALPLGKKASARWTEPAEGATERPPDRFRFTMPASAEARVTLTGGMEGRLLAEGASAMLPVPAGQGFHGTLASGAWVLEAVSSRKDSRVEYEVSVDPVPLVAGLSRTVTAPAEVSLAVGVAGLHEIASSGADDVRARLFDAKGTLVAANDDRDADWNFAMTRPLAPGAYTLRVEPAGAASAKTTVALRRLDAKRLPQESLPLAKELAPGRGVVTIPVAVPAGVMVSVAATAPESVGIAVATEDGTPLGQETGRAPRLYIPATVAGPGLVSLFSADGRGGRVRLEVNAQPLASWSEGQLAKGGGPGAASIRLERPGVFLFDGAARVSTRPGAPALPVEGAVAAADRLFVVAEGAVRARRVALDEKGVNLPAREARVDLAPAKGPVLVRARAAIGQPGLRVARGAATAADATALAATLEPARSVELLGDGADVALARVAFAAPKVEEPGALSMEGAVPAKGARAFALPPGPKRLHVALGAGVVALASRGGDGLALVGALESAAEETLDTDADRVTILNAGDEGRFALDVFPGAAPRPALGPGAPLAASLPDAGTLRVTVAAAGTAAAGEARALHVRGADGPATFLATDGRVTRGTDIPLPATGGALLLPHAPGLVLAWVDRAGHEAEDLFGPEAGLRPLSVTPPAAPALSGAVAAFDVVARGAAFLSMRAPGPALTLVTRAGAAPEVAIHQAGASMDVYAPSGRARVLLRALGTGGLTGSATFTATPVTTIGEGLGPETLLGAGQARLYGFHAPRDGAVGVGVRASSDLVTATLLDANGRRLSEGLVQMPNLPAGDYLVSVRAPADAAPVRVRPAVAGIDPPGTGPPPDVIREYVMPDAGVKGASATRTEESGDIGRGTEGEGDASPDAPEASAEVPADEESAEGEPQ